MKKKPAEQKPEVPFLAKIKIPRLPEIYNRQRLFRLLEKTKNYPVSWISAPAGSGKTTLIASYIQKKNYPCLWNTIDEGDFDLSAFFYYMKLAVSQFNANRQTGLPLLTPEYLLNVSVFTRRFFEKLYELLPADCIVVFDNYHLVANDSQLHKLLAIAMECLPEKIRMIVVSRFGPDASFSRLIANNQINVIGWEEIKFTREETEAFIHTIRKHIQFENSFVYEKTEGWAAGMILMINSIEKNPAFPSLSAAANNNQIPNHETIFNYFAIEVFNQTEKSLKDFLLKSAFLPEMTAAMAQEITGNVKAEKILGKLNRDNFFCQRTTGKTAVYLYHPLFRGFLLNQAKEYFNDKQVSEIKWIAAQILENSGKTEEAATLYLETGNFNHLEKLVLSHAETFTSSGRGRNLDEWIAALPGEIRENNPWLLYWQGNCRQIFFPAQARDFFEKAFKIFQTENDISGMFVSCAAIMNTYIYEFVNFAPLDKWIEVAQELGGKYKNVSPESMEQLEVALFNGLIWRQPGHPNLGSMAGRIKILISNHTDAQVRIKLSSKLFHYYLWLGNFSEGELLIKELRRSGANDPYSTLVLGLCEAYYYWALADYEKCRLAINEGLALAEKYDISSMVFQFLGLGVYNGLTLGDPAFAEKCMDKMSAFSDSRLLDRVFYCLLAAVSEYRREHNKAIDFGKRAVESAEKSGSPFSEALYRIELTAIWFAQGKHIEASNQLKIAMENSAGMKSIQYIGSLHGANLSFFANDRALKNEEKGLEFLQNGFATGASQGYMNLASLNNAMLSRLCLKALEHNIEDDYTHSLIRKRNLVPPKEMIISEKWPFVVRIYTIGRFDLIVNNQSVRFIGKVQKKPMDLLKLMITLGGKDIAISFLEDTIWPDAHGDMAHNSMKVTINRLRKILRHENALEQNYGKLSLDPDFVYIDVWELENIFSAAENADSETLIILKDRALRLFSGNFLPYGDFYTLVTEKQKLLSKKMNKLLFKCCDYYEKTGNSIEEISCLLKALNFENTNELIYQKLIMAYARTGNNSEALKIYNAYVEMMRLNFGTKPSLDMENLAAKTIP